MIDPAIRNAILSANQAEHEQAQRLAAIQIAGEGAAMAIAQTPVFKNIELVGQLALVEVTQPGFARIRLTGIGSTEAYTINMPVDWLRNVILEHDKQHDPPPEGDPAAAPAAPLEEAA